MVSQPVPTEQESVRVPSGEIVATDVSAEEYMQHYAADFHEWVKGTVIKMSPVSLKHLANLTEYLNFLLAAYFALRPIGKLINQPFVMRVDATESRREPDLQIVLEDNPGELSETAMIGAADICIEVVSKESTARDYGDKFDEYEQGGVREYWIIDPIRQECRFNRLNDAGVYNAVTIEDTTSI